MVCSIGSAKMAVMARILAAGSFSQTVAEKSGHHQLVFQYLDRQLHDAVEANLLDEEDMYVFDLKPLADPLYLVCCNTCKKPVKGSQYAAHAELCQSLVSTGEMFLEVETDVGSKKPRKKQRKKDVAAGNDVSSTGLQERSETIDTSNVAPTTSRLDKRIRVTSHSVEGNGCGIDPDIAAKVLGHIPTRRRAGKSNGYIRSSAKRPKVITAEIVQSSSGIVTAQSVSKVISSQKPSINAPAPLATKVYYSQRNSRLRAAINYMYHGTSGMTLSESKEVLNAVRENVSVCQDSSHSYPPDEQSLNNSEKRSRGLKLYVPLKYIDYHRFCPRVVANPSGLYVPLRKDKACRHSLAAQNAPATSQNLDPSLVRADGCQSSISHLEQFPINDALTSQTTAVEAVRS